MNRATTTLLNQPSNKLVGQILIGFVSDSEEKLSGYLRACSQSRRMILGTLTFSGHDGKDIACRSQGAVIQPRSPESPVIILLRLEKRTRSKFVVLNQKIHALSKEIQQRQKIQSELAQLQNRLHSSDCHSQIQVIKDYGGLPLIHCSASAINQVFINLLNNAVDALRDKEKKQALTTLEKEPCCIWIQTECIGDQQIGIYIRDNGSGIPSHVKNQIFNPFFTTKPVGKGTGLGLSITYQIIESHGGKISVQSTIESGTQLSIKLPISQF